MTERKTHTMKAYKREREPHNRRGTMVGIPKPSPKASLGNVYFIHGYAVRFA